MDLVGLANRMGPVGPRHANPRRSGEVIAPIPAPNSCRVACPETARQPLPRHTSIARPDSPAPGRSGWTSQADLPRRPPACRRIRAPLFCVRIPAQTAPPITGPPTTQMRLAAGAGSVPTSVRIKAWSRRTLPLPLREGLGGGVDTPGVRRPNRSSTRSFVATARRTQTGRDYACDCDAGWPNWAAWPI